MNRIGFVGTGHIAAPMVRFLSQRGHEIVVSNRNAATAEDLARTHGVAIAENQEVVDASDIVFLCLRPHVAAQVVSQLVFRSDQKIVSVMAGVSLAQLSTLCAPARDISITIPLGYLEKGGCPLATSPDANVLKSLFEPENPVFEVPDEAALNMHFAVCAFVPGLLDLMVTASGWLSDQTGDADQAARYTRQLVTGFLAALPDGGADLLPAERDALATKGTLSLQMTEGLHTGGAHSALRDTLQTIGDRLGDGS